MKSFFEEYGFVILAAIVVIILIAMATPIGDLVKIQVSEVVNSFGSKTQSKLNATDGIIQVRVSTANNKITLEWDANKKEDVFKYSYKASNTKGEANWTNKADVTINDKNRTVTIENDSNNQPLANKTKVEYKIYDSNDQLVASGVVTAKVGKSIDGGSGETGGDSGGGSTGEISGVTTGKVLTIADKEYTVIECNGTQCKVLATERFQKAFDSSGINSIDYATSTIAAYLDDDYYNGLDSKVQNAIVPTSIQQKIAKEFNWDNNNITWESKKDAGTYKVFIPSWDEVTKVYGSTPAEIKSYSNGKFVWLRDIVGGCVLDVNETGHFNNNYSGNGNYYVRPAFVLDLSKVTYTIVK